MSTTITVTPASAAVLVLTVAQVKEWLRIADDTSHDDTIESLILAAQTYVENRIHGAMLTRTVIDVFDGFPSADEFQLPTWPLASVTSITYLDSNGDSQTLSASTIYTTDTDAVPGRVLLRHGQSWPATASRPATVTVTYSAGYGVSSDSVPDPLLQAVRFIVAHWFENRLPVSGDALAEVPASAEAILQMYTHRLSQ
jgi:uncharacterized phiE125 gp8 family phage protein